MKRIAITMGDPAGVGPELCLRLCAAYDKSGVNYLIYGNRKILERVGEYLGLSTEGVEIVNHEITNVAEIQAGQVQASCGQAAYDFLNSAINDAVSGKVDAIVTCPLNKAALEAAGIDFPGHTEILVSRTGAKRHAMMLSGSELSCALVTTHIGLAEVAAALTTERIIEVTQLSAEVMQKRHGRPAKLAILGLNPHAGEGGLFGNKEEERVIQPAIDKLRDQDLDVIGPLPPDTAFLPSIRPKVDAYVCMYHDQGLIPLKTLCFDEGVNVTLGLPIVRTSVDHGTAFDIAWTGKAKVDSLIAAVDFALELV